MAQDVVRVCLFEDAGVAGLEPLSATRPAFDLLCGASLLREKQCRAFAATEWAAIVRPELVALTRQRYGVAVNDPDHFRGGRVTLVNARWLPSGDPVPDNEHVALADGTVAYARIDAARLAGVAWEELPDLLRALRRELPAFDAQGRLVGHLWELVDLNGDEVVADFPAVADPDHVGRRAANVALVGPSDALCIHPSARIDPMVVFDTTNGPVLIDRDAHVLAFSRVEGPCYVGPGTQVHGAKVRAGSSFGPQCRVGGEVEASVLLGQANKYHEGFLGHSYLGEWVNLGAGTHTSDLRNDYGPVTVYLDGRPEPTGRRKVGSFLGDHVKTGLGTLLNTGTVAGPFAHLLPAGGFAPRSVPAFARFLRGALCDDAELPALLRTAAEVMRRRGCDFTPAHQDLYEWLYDRGTQVRRQALREAEQRRLKRVA